MNRNRLCLSLIKGRHRYVFWYYEGQESQLAASFARLAQDPRTNFDGLDAATLSHQVGERIGNTADCQIEIAP